MTIPTGAKEKDHRENTKANPAKMGCNSPLELAPTAAIEPVFDKRKSASAEFVNQHIIQGLSNCPKSLQHVDFEDSHVLAPRHPKVLKAIQRHDVTRASTSLRGALATDTEVARDDDIAKRRGRLGETDDLASMNDPRARARDVNEVGTMSMDIDEGTDDQENCYHTEQDAGVNPSAPDVRQYDVDFHGGPGLSNEITAGDDVVVAIPVDEDGADPFLSSAAKYDPDAKPENSNTRKFLLYVAGFGVFLLVDIIVAVIVVALLTAEGPATLAPTMAPSLSPTGFTAWRYQQYFAAAVGQAVFEEGTPEYYASEWILNDDLHVVERGEASIVQRFILVLFYLSSTQNGDRWDACNRPLPGEEETCEFEMMDEDFGSVNIFAHRWLTDEHECQWVGITCDTVDSVVRNVQLTGLNIAGTLPSELATLPFLVQISLGSNSFTGTLPTSFGSIQGLEFFDVDNNMLSGTVPKEYYAVRPLKRFNIAENILTGTIGSAVGQLTNLWYLYLHSNYFSGTMPPELSHLKNMHKARVSDNIFSGTVPTEFGTISSSLSELNIAMNQLTGTIPSELGLLEQIRALGLSWNRISGPIPEELFKLSTLLIFDLSDNYMTGTLSSQIANLHFLQVLKVNYNVLIGTIPTELASMRLLSIAYLHMNEFIGDVPLAICDLRPHLEILNADCDPEWDPVNACECCTLCCDRTTEICQEVHEG